MVAISNDDALFSQMRSRHHDRGSPYFLRFKEEFRGPIIPFGAECEYQPASPQDKARILKLGSKTLRGIITGYKQRAGGGWANELYFVDWEELEEASSAHDVQIKSMHYKEITEIKTPKGEFKFPLAEGALNQPGIRPKESIQRARKQKISKEDMSLSRNHLHLSPQPWSTLPMGKTRPLRMRKGKMGRYLR